MSDKLLTSRTITNALFWALRGASDLIIPRFTPRGWWECDVWRLTKAGFVDEYEIKLSVSDWKADTLKYKDEKFELQGDGKWGYTPGSGRNKHTLLATTEEGPNRFWFVTTYEISKQVVIPSWAGLMVTGGTSAYVETAAPKRHGNKWNGNRARLMDTFYHRYWTHEAGKQSEIEPFGEELDATLNEHPATPAHEQPALL